MSEQKTFREKTREQLEKWKADLEELNVQLRLGRAEAEDAFEEQKKKFAGWLDKRREQLDELEDSGEDYLKDLRARLEKLSNRLTKGDAADKDTYAVQREEIVSILDEAEQKAEEAREKGTEEAREASENVQDTLEQLRTRLDLFWLKFNLGKAEMKEELEERRKKANTRIQELKHKLDESEDAAEDRWDNFKDEMKEAFRHVRKAISGKD